VRGHGDFDCTHPPGTCSNKKIEMAINANHPFEELNGVRCAVVEKNCSKERVTFLTYILEGNDFDVVVVPSPPPKSAPVPKPAATPTTASEAASTGNAPAADAVSTPDAPAPAMPTAASEPAPPPPPPASETFTVGVTDVTFNVINAIYGRLLRSPDGRVVTISFWQQKDEVSRDDIPYYAR
jgi:hypothetical protein